MSQQSTQSAQAALSASNQPSIHSTRPIVIGGGLAGLTAALHLAERGLAPLVLEANQAWTGGRVRGGPVVSFEHRDQTWSFRGEHGVHGFWNNYVNLKGMLQRHAILPEFVPAQQETWLHLQDGEVRRANVGRTIRSSLVPAPFHSFALLGNLGFWRMLGLFDWLRLPLIAGSLLLPALSIDPLAEEQALHGLTLADIMQHWPRRPRGFIAALLRNGLASTPEDIPLASAIAFLRFYTLLRRDAWQFGYLPGDPQTHLLGPINTAIEALGGTIQLGTEVTALLYQADHWQLSCMTATGSATFRASQVILATDPPTSERLLRSSPSTKQVADQLRWPGGQSTVIARVWFARAPRRAAEAGICSGDFWIDNVFWLERIYEDYVRWHAATGGAAVEVHIYGPPEHLAAPDAVLLAHVIEDLQRMYPELRGTILHRVLLRNPASHTRFGVGSSADHLGVETPWPQLWACGDWIRHPAPALFLERACVTGLAAANALLVATGHVPHPVASYPAPEPTARWVEVALTRWRRWLTRRKHERLRKTAP